MRSFNILADGKDRIPEERILEMNRTETVPEEFRFAGKDPFFAPGQVLMRRTSGNACLTIMDGGHGGNYRAGCYWLNRQRRGRPVDWSVPDSADADDREIHAITN